MGRRALRKPDPTLDLSPYLRTVDELPRPFDQRRLFERAAPLEVELGSGKGLFIQTAAAEFPDRNFLGIEVIGKYAQHAAARLAKHGLTNAMMVRGDGLPVFRELLPTAGVAAVHVYFPDPWWKKRHRKRRVMNDAFARDVVRILPSGGQLHFWTDVKEYFDNALAMLAGHPELQGPLTVAERPAEHTLDYRTHFERRMRLHDKPVYRSQYIRA